VIKSARSLHNYKEFSTSGTLYFWSESIETTTATFNSSGVKISTETISFKITQFVDTPCDYSLALQ